MCPKTPKPVVNKPAYQPEDIDKQIEVTEEGPKGSKVGSPGKTANDAGVPTQGSGVAVRR